jgi:hypothetical protein
MSAEDYFKLASDAGLDATMQIGNRSKDPYYKIFSKELEDYIYVTGSHYIKHGDKYVKVCDFPDSIRTEEYGKVLSCLVTSTHREFQSANTHSGIGKIT